MVLTCAVVLAAASALADTHATPAPTQRKPLPIIPGAAGFGIHTPAGSGRHLARALLIPDVPEVGARHWHFDDGLPKEAKSVGAPALVARGKGKALRLDGKSALELPDPKGHAKPGAGFTVMAWARIDAPGGLVAWNRDEDESSWELGSTASFGGKWRFYVGETKRNSAVAALTGHVSPDTWRHVAGVYRTDGTLRFYLNGNLVATVKGNSLKGVKACRTANLVVGKGIQGQIDDVMLIDRPLTNEQVLFFFARQHDDYFPSRTEVYRVTNLSDSGPGSLREGFLTQERARIIVFQVSGTIALESPIGLGPTNSYVTVAGATAPSPGITIKDRGFRVGSGCHDVLIRHLRIRTGDTTVCGRLPDGWTDVDGDGPDTVFSHPLAVTPQKAYGAGSRRSVWWNGKDLVEDPGKTTQVGRNKWDWDPGVNTVKKEVTRSTKGVLYINVGGDPSRGKVEYGLYKSSVCDPLTLTPGTRNVVIDHMTCTWGGDMNMQTQGSHVTIQNCLSAEALHHPRHPKGAHSRGLLVFAYGPNQGEYTCVVGNLFAYNMARNPTVSKGHMVLVANNLVSDVNVGIRLFDSSEMNSVTSTQRNVLRRANSPFNARVVNKERPQDTKTHISPDNMVDGKTFGSVKDIWKQVVTNPFKAGTQPESCKVETSPVTVPGLKLRPVEEVEEYVLANAGARPADRDSVDKRIIENVKTGKGKLPIASQDEVGGWPELKENRRELAVPDNPNGDDDGDGYTNVEEWLHDFAAEVEGRSD